MYLDLCLFGRGSLLSGSSLGRGFVCSGGLLGLLLCSRLFCLFLCFHRLSGRLLRLGGLFRQLLHGFLQLGHFLDLFGLLGFFLAGLTDVGAYAPEKLAGTYPETATQGFDDAGYVVVQTADGSSTYAAPASGDLTAGLHPATATSGGTSGGGLVAEESGLGVSYIAKVCGSAPGINF